MLKKVVIIPGGFHPFHAGHKALYDAAVAQFPKADVFIAATDDKSNRPFPFKLKKQLAGIAGIPAHRFVQVKSPFQPKEITGLYDPEDTQLYAVIKILVYHHCQEALRKMVVQVTCNH